MRNVYLLFTAINCSDFGIRLDIATLISCSTVILCFIYSNCYKQLRKYMTSLNRILHNIMLKL